MNTAENSENLPAIAIDHVTRRFGKRDVLRDVTLEVRPGEIFGLLGPSGSGKTTLVKLIVGMDEPTSGKVMVGHVRMPSLQMLSCIGYMAQSDALYGELTAQENLEFFGSLFGLRGLERAQRIREVMKLVNLSDALRRNVAIFSGGMRRRLSLAIALLHRPSILILDEPTIGIDPLLRKSVWDELWRVSEQGATIVVTTHVMDEAEKCSRLGMIREGRLIATGTPEALKLATSSSTLEGAFLVYGGAHT